MQIDDSTVAVVQSVAKYVMLNTNGELFLGKFFRDCPRNLFPAPGNKMSNIDTTSSNITKN